MRKFTFFFAFILITSTSIIAQVETRKIVLLNTAKLLDLESRASYSNAVIKAKEKGWPLFYKSRNNTVASLVGMDSFGQPIYYTSYADPIHAITVNTNKLWPAANFGFNLTGESDSLTNTLGVWDQASVRTTHYELRNRITQKDNASEIIDHGTHVLGIMMGKGINPLAKGMAYNLKGAYSYDWNNDNSEMAAAAANGLLISNHSYGIVSGWDQNNDSSDRWEYNGRWNEKEDYRFGLYNSEAQIHDSVMYNAPYYLILKAAGNNHGSTGPTVGSTYWRRDVNGKMYNAGARPDSLSSNNSYETLSADINAKNILVVGAVRGLTSPYTKKEDVIMSSFSSWGPTDDGRIKPDIVADGVSVLSAVATNDSSYGYLNGTSMATPNAAGSLLLLQELSQQLSPKKFLRATTVKALAIHTANEAGGNPGPDYQFGWGLLNMYEAAASLKNALVSKNASTSSDLVYENVLQNKDSAVYNIVASGKKPIKATVVWNDIKGTPGSLLNDTTPELVNDIDVTITQGTAVTAAWKLNPAFPTNAATRGNNRLDNVEKVEIENTIVGNSYKIKVAHKGELVTGQQAYSLIISGGGGSTYCPSTATSNAGSKIDSISLYNIQYVNTTSNQYIDNSNLIINGEANGIIPVFIKLGSADATNNNRFVKIFIDYNNNGLFEDNELVSTSTGILNSNYNTTITLPDSLAIGSFTKLRVVVMESDNSAAVKSCGNYTAGETQDYTLKIFSSSNDLQVTDIVSPTVSACKKDVQYVTIKISNNGSIAKSNFPLNLIIKKGTTTLATLNETFYGRLGGAESMNYTFQKPMSLDASTTYSFTATVTIPNDQVKENNTYTGTITTAANSVPPSGTATNCNGLLKLAVSSPVSGKNYFWYDTAAIINPIAMGTSINTNSTKSNLYLTQGYQGFAGPISNTTLANTGSYNKFSGNFVKINATAPMTIETSKIYTGYPGKIEIILATLAAFNTDGSYSYYSVQSVTLNAPASSPNPVFPRFDSTSKTYIETPYVAGDSGRIYHLDLQIPQAGDYILIVKCDSASIFRNNGLGTSTYPQGPNKLFSVTGNSVQTPSNFQNYYYFFYNNQIKTADCLSAAATIPVNVAPKPTIKYQGDSLLSSDATSYQWYMNDELISGATKQSYKPTKNALYKVSATANSCQLLSDNNLILITDLAEASAKEINLKITSTDYIENLIKGNSFYIQFSIIQTQGIGLDVMNSMGIKVAHKENLINQRSPQKIDIGDLTTGIYFIKIYANNKVYVQRVFITNN